MRQLDEYFAGTRREFDLPLAPDGTPFQLRVWQALQTIPYGGTWSYRELAAAVGNVQAVRAVGLANGRNPLPIVIPCHRVIGSDGSLTGYGGGLPTKRSLLALEHRVLANAGQLDLALDGPAVARPLVASMSKRLVPAIAVRSARLVAGQRVAAGRDLAPRLRHRARPQWRDGARRHGQRRDGGRVNRGRRGDQRRRHLCHGPGRCRPVRRSRRRTRVRRPASSPSTSAVTRR